MPQLMTTQIEPASAVQPPAEGPFLVEFFMVEGVGFRCMAYCDPDGKWRNAINDGELPGDIRLVE
jgi:hypothetical protein